MQLNGIDYIEFYVSDIAKNTALLQHQFGFQLIAMTPRNPKTNMSASLLLKQNNIHLILTTDADIESEVTDFLTCHQDGVRDIAFRTDDIDKTFHHALKQGAKSLLKPTVMSGDGQQTLIKAAVRAFGDTIHSFIQRDESTHDLFFPGFDFIRNIHAPSNGNLTTIDHVAICIPAKTLNHWTDFYCKVFGFQQTHEENVYTEYSGMNSKVVQSAKGEIKLTLVEPAPGKHSSQVANFLAMNQGPGVQHIAFASNNILQAVTKLQKAGVKFLKIPPSYYENTKEIAGKMGLSYSLLQKNQVLIDKDKNGYLLQIFSKPLHEKCHYFFEVIQRNGAQGFGSNNIHALFKALEIEQISNEMAVDE